MKRIVRQREQADGDVGRRISTLKKQAANLARAIAQGGELDALLAQLRLVNDGLEKARREEAKSTAAAAAGQAFASREWVESRLDEALVSVPATSFEFADLMRRIVPEFLIQPVQALDTPFVRPRAQLTLRLHGLHQAAAETSEQADDVRVVLDLFEPPLYIRHLQRCLAARAEHPQLSQRKISGLLELNDMTVKRAFDYARLMASLGTSKPYRELHACPEQASRWHTHQESD